MEVLRDVIRKLHFCRSTIALLFAVAALALPAAETVRVVSQTVGGDEMLLALAEPSQVAALSHISRDAAFSAVAAEAARFPHIVQGDAETILRFSPTLVLFADYSRAELVAQVQRAGVRVLVFERYETLDDAYANLRSVARELGSEARCEKLIASCDERVAQLRRRLAEVKPVRVLAPSTYGLISGTKTTFHDMCEHAAAENLGATLGHLTGYAPPPTEQMLTWPVDIVIVGGTNLDEALAPFRSLPPYQFLPAVKSGRAVLIRPHLLSCVSHHRIDGYEELARALHPEAFR